MLPPRPTRPSIPGSMANAPRGLLDLLQAQIARQAGSSQSLQGAGSQASAFGEEGNDPTASTPMDAPISEWGLGPISGYGVFRGQDAYGAGAFGEPRKKSQNGQIISYGHTGVDVGLYDNTVIYAPASGVMRRSKPYENDPLEGVEITTADGRKIQLLYVNPSPELFAELGEGKTVPVEAGQTIGGTQTLQQRFPPKQEGSITDHVHVRVKDKFGNVIDPTPWLENHLEVPEHLGRSWVPQM